MGIIKPNKVGLVLGALMGAWHLCWVLLVAVGWAQPVLNFVFWMHFLNQPYTVRAFQPGVAAILIAITAATGYVTGYVLGMLWNCIHREQ